MDFGSTVHPFFLTCNLTQVIVTLEGLKEMCKKPEYKGYALPMAQSIWEQLSDYGKERIYFVTENLLNQEVSIIELLEEGWKVSVAGKEQILDREKIIRCSYHKENMY